MSATAPPTNATISPASTARRRLRLRRWRSRRRRACKSLRSRLTGTTMTTEDGGSSFAQPSLADVQAIISWSPLSTTRWSRGAERDEGTGDEEDRPQGREHGDQQPQPLWFVCSGSGRSIMRQIAVSEDRASGHGRSQRARRPDHPFPLLDPSQDQPMWPSSAAHLLLPSSPRLVPGSPRPRVRARGQSEAAVWLAPGSILAASRASANAAAWLPAADARWLALTAFAVASGTAIAIRQAPASKITPKRTGSGLERAERRLPSRNRARREQSGTKQQERRGEHRDLPCPIKPGGEHECCECRGPRPRRMRAAHHGSGSRRAPTSTARARKSHRAAPAR